MPRLRVLAVYVTLMGDHGTPTFYEFYGVEASLTPRKAGMAVRIK